MEKFQYVVRPAAVFAGVIGILQSALWISLSVTGIVAYYCHMDMESLPNALGSVFELTFLKLYFNGPCDQQLTQNVDFTVLNNLNLMEPVAVHAMLWAYLMLSFFWMISSVTMLTNMQIKYIRFANIFIFIWIALTGLISILDLSFGILFGLDYGILMTAAFDVPLTNTILSSNAVLLAGQASAGVMMGVAFRGFILWLINVTLVFFFFTQTFIINDFNKMHGVGAENPAFVSDKPMDGYGFTQNRQPAAPMWFSHYDAGRPSNNRQRSYSQNSIYDDRRQRPMTTANEFHNYPIRRRDDDVVLRNNNVVREMNDRNSLNMNNNVRRNDIPNPDYSPPMPRNNNPYDNSRHQQAKTMMRSSRF